jgi:hypothetical protein
MQFIINTETLRKLVFLVRKPRMYFIIKTETLRKPSFFIRKN